MIGKTGQLASALRKLAPQARYYDRAALDLSADPHIIAQFIRDMPRAQTLIIAAAYTDVDKAESEPELAFNINARAPGVIARECAARGIRVIYISTDCVFDGKSPAPYRPDDTPQPINMYGVSKREGEQAVMEASLNNVVIRTSWVFDAGHVNFMTKMIALGQNHKALTIVSDQIGRPTYAPDLARAILAMAQQGEAKGIFHIAGSGTPVSRADWARAIFEHLKISVRVSDIPTTAFPTPARRGLNAVLDISDFEARLDHVMPDWTEGLRAAMQDRT